MLSKHLLRAMASGHIDFVIANRGLSKPFVKIADARIEDVREHMEVNYIRTLKLYQATLRLLLKAKNPKCATMGSGAGFIVVSYNLNF
jgi:norsolorinic acid ketoreductase